MTFEQLLKQFSEQIPGPPLLANSDDQYPIVADGITVLCFYASGQVYLLGELASLEKNDKNRLLQITQLLQICLVNLGNTRESVSINKETLCIHRQLPLQKLTLHEFVDAVSDIFDSIDYFKKNLNVTQITQPQTVVMS